jgi:hypothetical protein
MEIARNVKKKIRELFALLMCISVLIFSCETYATVEIDQEYLPYVTLTYQATITSYIGQSFTVGKTGRLVRIDVSVWKAKGTTSDLEFYVFRIVNGNPIFPPIASLTVPNTQIPTDLGFVRQLTGSELLSIDLSSFNIFVKSGDVIGTLVHTNLVSDPYMRIDWVGGCNNNISIQCGNSGITSDGYTRGQPLGTSTLGNFFIYPRTDFDSGFRTYVDTSEFLSFPLNMTCQGNPCTPYTAKISSVMDHSGTPLDHDNPRRWYSHDGKVKAHTGEEGQCIYGTMKYNATTGQDQIVKSNKLASLCGDIQNQKGIFSYQKVDGSAFTISGQGNYLSYDGHSGYDYPAPSLTPIVAPADGRLYKATYDTVNHNCKCDSDGWDEWHSFYIDHGNGFTTWYLHVDHLSPDIEAQIGNDFTKSVEVKQGQTIAYTGNFGQCSPVGQHLHFEVRRGREQVVDPYSEGMWNFAP